MTLADPLNIVGTTILDKYRIESVVGEGGFAIVYRATHLIWKRSVAIKAFRALGSYSSDKREMLIEGFIREGMLLAELSERSAAIVQARDIVTLILPDGNAMPCMVLEWLEGETLEAVIERERKQAMTPRTVQAVVDLLEPAAEALALAHATGIAHRDVKPANIFILGDARSDTFGVKLLDFGIAKVVQDAQKLAGSFSSTVGHVTSFTPAYAAPEQFSRAHGSTGPWTDVFALALIFTELVTGRPTLDGDSLAHLAFMASDPTRRPTPRMFGVMVADGVEAVLLRALAVNPEERYPSGREFWNALREAMALPPLRATHRMQESPSGRGVSKVPSGSGPRVSTAPIPSPTLSSAPHLPGPPIGGPRLGSGPLPLGSGPLPLGSGPLPLGSGPPVQNPAHARPFAPAPSPPGVSSNLKAILGGAAVGVVALGAILTYFVVARADARRAANRPRAVTSAVAVPAPSASAPAAPSCPPGMVHVPRGKFFMGSDDKVGIEFERPAHQVTVGAFCIDIFEVTTASYKACSDTGDCIRAGRENDWDGITAQDKKAFDPLCTSRDPDQLGKHPVNCVDWNMVTAFCASQKKRLPTEAEWEFAARGSDGRLYPWGDDPPGPSHLNACGKECVAWGKKNHVDETAMYDADDGWPNTAPVGSFPEGRSPFGLQDVVGNVWEWTADWFGPYSAEAADNPKGPATGEQRVIRGGGWNGAQPSWVRPTFRYRDEPVKRSYGVGFRCARDG